MKKTCLIIALCMLICTFFSCFAYADNYTGVIEKDGVMQMGDFESLVDGFVIYYPIGIEESKTKYPVAVWANGTVCPPALYYDLLVGVAKHGYIVIASSDVMSKDGKSQREAIDYILEKSKDSTSPFYGKVDSKRIGAFGHSQGGLSCVNASIADDRIGAIVSIAGASTKTDTQNLKVPSLFLTGSLDTIVLASLFVKPSYEGCPAPAAYASLKKGVHTSCVLDADKYIDYTVKWFDAWLGKGGDKAIFEAGGAFSKDSSWTDYKSKNFDVNLTGSIFGLDANIWIVIELSAIIVITSTIIVVTKRRKQKA